MKRPKRFRTGVSRRGALSIRVFVAMDGDCECEAERGAAGCRPERTPAAMPLSETASGNLMECSDAGCAPHWSPSFAWACPIAYSEMLTANLTFQLKD